MNRSIYLFFGSAVLAAACLSPFSIRGQEAGTDGQKLAVKADASVKTEVKFLPSTRVAKKRAASSAAYNWTGFYIGDHFGYARGEGNTLIEPLPTAAQFINLAPTTLDSDPKGWTGGLQGGYNRQLGHLVVGGEADFTWSNAKGTRVVTPITQNNGTPFPGAGFLIASQNTKWFGTLRGRAGVAVGRGLLYGTGGLAYAKVNYGANADFRPFGTESYPAVDSKTKRGWTLGYGFELGVTRHFSWKFEYLYYRLGSETFTANPAIPLPPFQIRYTWKASADTINGGINFRF